jgi:hypothetical protein
MVKIMATLAIIGLLFLIATPLFSQTYDIGDLVICIDASGSMRFPFPVDNSFIGTCAELLEVDATNSRYYLIHSALEPVMTMFRDYVDDIIITPVENGYAAVVRFPGRGPEVTEIILDHTLVETAVSNPFQDIMGLMNNINEDEEMFIECSINGTPLGAALNTCKTILDEIQSITGQTDEQVILLITDGENNRAPFDLMSSSEDPGRWITDQAGHESNIRIYTIGIGDETGSFYDDLANISSETDGNFYAFFGNSSVYSGQGTGIYWPEDGPTPAKTLANSLDDWIANYLNYQGISDPCGTIAAQQMVEETLPVTPLDRNLLFAIHWNPPEGNYQPSIRIILDDETIMEADTTRTADGYRITRGVGFVYIFVFDTLIQNHYGDWKLQLDGSLLPYDVQYSYSIYTQSDLKLLTDFAKAQFETGELLKDQIQVGLSGERISDATGEVFIRAPENWLGNWNAKQQLARKELEILSGENWEPDLSLLNRKRLYLQANKDISFPRKIQILPWIDLRDDGMHQDGESDDGVYGFSFSQLTKPGIYEIGYRVTGKTPEGHPFKRESYFHKYVSVAVDNTWRHSKIDFEKVSQDDEMIAADIYVLFKDEYKNVGLPDMSREITIIADRGSLIGELIDNVDGSYIQRIMYDEREGRPNIYVTYGDKSFPEREIVYGDDNEHISGFISYFFFDSKIGIDDGFGFGVRLAKNINPHFSLEVESGLTSTQDSFNNTGRVVHANVNLVYDVKTSGLTPFITIGAGMLSFNGFSSNDEGLATKFGGGLKYRFKRFDLHVGAADFIAYGVFGNDTSHNIQTTVGITYKF